MNTDKAKEFAKKKYPLWSSYGVIPDLMESYYQSRSQEEAWERYHKAVDLVIEDKKLLKQSVGISAIMQVAAGLKNKK